VALALHSQNGSTVDLRDVSEDGLLVRISHGESEKVVGGQRTTHHKTTIVINDDTDITLNGETVAERVAVRITLAGSSAAGARMQQLLADVVASSSTWLTEGVFKGFTPSTYPTITAES
jgi:hypothetical protein